MTRPLLTHRILALAARPDFWLACLLAWLLLSAGRSLGTPWARAALTEALRWGAGIGLALALGLALPRPDLGARLATVLAGLMALAGVWGGLQPGQGGLAGPYHDHQLYGSALLVLLPLPVALTLSSRVPAWRWGGLAVAGGGAACLILSETRSAWAGGLAASLVFAGLWLSRSGRLDTLRRDGRRVLLPLLLLIGMAGVFWMTADGSLRGPLTQRAGTLTALGGDGSWQGRLSDWRGAGLMVAKRPLTGIGLGRYPSHQSAGADGGQTLGPDARPSLSEEAHSFYLQTAAETGLIGLGLYGGFLAAFAVQALRGLRQSRGRGSDGRAALLIAALSLTAGQAVDALASPSWQFAETSLLFWGLLGVGLASLRHPEAEESAAYAPPHRLGRYMASGLAAVALAANLLPIGLLTPVEAYNHSSTVAFDHGVVTRITAGCPSGSLCFSLTAFYADGRSYDVTFDSGNFSNGSAGTPSHFNCATGAPNYLGACSGGTFPSGATRNQIVTTQSSGSAVRIIGTFQDNSYAGSNVTASQKPSHLDMTMP